VTGKTNSGSSGNPHRLPIIANRSRHRFSSPSSSTHLLTNTHYLVDTGAALSLIPFNSTSPPSGPTIVNANGKPIPSWNFISQNVQFHNNQFSHSFFASKSNGSWRPCGDYRRLNNVTTPDKYPLPNMQDLSTFLYCSKIFTKLDLSKGYYQVPMNEGDIPKTAIITPFGLYEFLFMPFGLKNATQAFQRLMDSLFHAIPFIFTYLDDILIFSPSCSQHLSHLHTIFSIIAENGLHINQGPV
jgi:hypothetical protein